MPISIHQWRICTIYIQLKDVSKDTTAVKQYQTTCNILNYYCEAELVMDAQDGLTYDLMFGPRLPWSQDTIEAQWGLLLTDP